MNTSPGSIVRRIVSLSWILAVLSAAGVFASTPAANPGLLIHELRYEANITETEARVNAVMIFETRDKQEHSQLLFDGDLALLPPKLPAGIRVEREGSRYLMVVSKPGRHEVKLTLIARIVQRESWNEISLTGPPAAIASVRAEAAGSDVDLQLQSGTVLDSNRTNGTSRLTGFLGADHKLALRWSRVGGTSDSGRKPVITADTTAVAQISPAVIKYNTTFRFDVVQGKVSSLAIALPGTHSLTRLSGDQIRDWQIQPDGSRQLLTVQFLVPIDKQFHLVLISEQPAEAGQETVALALPQPLDIQREAGQITVSAEDMTVDIARSAGLRQINAPEGSIAAYRFYGQQFDLAANVKRIEPVIAGADRVMVRLEETRLLITHQLTLAIDKAGIYTTDLLVPDGFVVADVRGEGIDDWKTADGILRVNFASRALGSRNLEIQLEQPLKEFPENIGVAPLRVKGAVKETAHIGAGSGPGIRLKTLTMTGAREIPVRALPGRLAQNESTMNDELLAFTAEQPDWNLVLASERLPARVVAEVFNLVTIGDGIVGGSATIRYGLLNQGVQEFRVRVPAHWRNVEFTGPNIRRKERVDDVWTLGLQDKAWEGYTLVVTYDFQFDPHGATLSVGGIHALNIERETGSVAITTAASLKVEATTASDTLRRIDETELAASDRALVTRAVLLAYRYAGDQYDLAVSVARHSEVPVLAAVADRTQLTTVLTPSGEMLTQASFMVKNNDKQFQRFQLPKGVANVWSCHVNGQPVKPERDGNFIMIPLPRVANRDQAFAVDIVYAEKREALGTVLPRGFRLEAPRTDVPNTYAEWQVFVPETERLSSFGGNMAVARGTTYGFRDALAAFTAFYTDILAEPRPGLLLVIVIAISGAALLGAAIRRGLRGIAATVGLLTIVGILCGMLLPALSQAKIRAQRVNAINNLKQIGLAARIWAGENGDRLPMSFEEMKNELNTDKITIDPNSGQRFVWVGGGVVGSDPTAVIAYSPVDTGKGRAVALADGSVQWMSTADFADLSRRISLQTAAQPPGLLSGGSDNSAAGTPARTVAGIRSIRIELPLSGQAFTFTKVLNVHDEPLSLQMKSMSLHSFQTIRMCFQTALFLTGLGLLWFQWRGAKSSIGITVALALVFGSVGSLLIAWRVLHTVLIIALPLALLMLIGFAVWLRRPARKADEPSAPSGETASPVVATIALLFILPLFTGTSAAAERPAVSILSAFYSGAVTERVARVDATINVSSDKLNQTIPLFSEEIAIQQFQSKPSGAKLVRVENGYAVVLPRKGDVTLQFKLLVKLSGDFTRRQFTLGIPAALSSRMTLTIDQPEADVEFPSAVAFNRATTGQHTRVEATIGAAERIQLTWTPRVKRAAEVASTVFCQNTALASFGGGVVNVRSTLEYQITQGELRQARVRIPPGHRLLRVEGAGIRNWEVKDQDDFSILVIDLLKDTTSAWRAIVETEMPLDRLPSVVTVEIPRAMDVKRESGLIALRGAEELSLLIESTDGLQRVDADEFNRADGGKADGLLSVFRYVKPGFSLRARAETVQPQIEAVVHNTIRLSAEEAALSALVNYTIKRAGVFSLKVRVPEGYRVEQVAGSNIVQWTESRIDGAPIVDVTLSQRTTGETKLRFELIRLFRELPATFAVEGVNPVNTSKLSGYVAVQCEPGVSAKTAAFDGLTEIPFAALPDHAGLSAAGSVLAYKYVAAQSESAEWTLTVATERIEAWARAEIVNTLTFNESLVTGRAIVRYEIQNAPMKEFRIRVPATFRNVEITGANIRRRDFLDGAWTIEVQNKVRGIYALNVSWDQPPASGTNVFEVSGVSADGVERETGVLAINSRAPLQVNEQIASDLVRIDTADVPDWADRGAETPVLAYKYLRPGYRLAIGARRFDEAEVLQALVENVNLTTVVADDGQMMTTMTLSVRNNGRQHLEIVLPPQSTNVWSAFVDGQAVRPSLRDGKLLLPLERSEGGDAPVNIELTYVGFGRFPRSRGPVELVSPRLDAPLKNARWEVFLPPDYEYKKFGGTMTRESAAAPQITSFSSLEYSRREQLNRVELQKEVRSELKGAKDNLTSGNVKLAVGNLYRARNKGDLADAGELAKLEEDVRRAQSSNLINAQQAFVFFNNSPNGNVSAPSQTPVTYDSAAAEAQWKKLQQAQEVGVTKVRPLRVNLPTRGLRHSFSQILQTGTGKPMTIQLTAANTKSGGWFQNTIAVAATMLVLWGMVVVLTGAARRKFATTA